MPYARPTVAELVTRARSDFRGRLSFAGVLLRRAMTDVLAAVSAGGAHELHGHLAWIVKQLFVKTADREYLIRFWGPLYNLPIVAATYASGPVVATGTNGTDIPEDTLLVRSDGALYRVTALATISGGEATLAVTAEAAGDAGDWEAGQTLSFQSPIAGVDATATVDTAGLTGGHDEEDTEVYRTRLLERKRRPPTGGSDQDYIAWTKLWAGVTRVWVYRHEDGLGTVTVRFMLGDAGDVFPAAGDVTGVQAILESKRPTTAEVTAAAPTALTVPFTISITPDTAANRAAITAELKDLFDRVGEPGDGAGRGTILLSELRTAIGVIVGNYTLTTPSASVVPALGQRPVVGAITWT